jgi:hypothetical protein
MKKGIKISSALRGVGFSPRGTSVPPSRLADLVHQPLVETRNRRPVRPNPIAPWPRIGDLRVSYEMQEEHDPLVTILAVGVKERNVARIMREVADL